MVFASTKRVKNKPPARSQAQRDYALIYVNGVRHEVRGDDAFLMLADWLRKSLGLVGTKIVCAEGDCGACSVLRAFPKPGDKRPPSFVSINSCIATVAQMDTSHLVTVEGFAKGGELSPVQKAMMNSHGSQCGFCTPGFVVALTAGIEAKQDSLTEKQGMNALTGNLCRCTGYLPIVKAASSVPYDPAFAVGARYLTKDSLSDLRAAQEVAVEIHRSTGECFYAPTSERHALKRLKTKGGKSAAIKIMGAGTDLGVQQNKGALPASDWLSLHLIPETYSISVKRGRMHIGSRVTLESLRQASEDVFPELAGLLNVFASPQIKNVATLVGNIANGSPIGDTLPLLMVVEASVHLRREWNGRVVERIVPLDRFYRGYRDIDRKSNEIVAQVSLTLPDSDAICRFYKVSRRKDLDISTVSAAFYQSKRATRVAYGGIAATAKRLPDVEAALAHAKDVKDLGVAIRALDDSISPLSDFRGSSEYRRVVSENLMRRFWEERSQ